LPEIALRWSEVHLFSGYAIAGRHDGPLIHLNYHHAQYRSRLYFKNRNSGVLQRAWMRRAQTSRFSSAVALPEVVASR